MQYLHALTYKVQPSVRAQEDSYYVLLHGLFGNSDNLKIIQKMIAPLGGTILLYDLPNHGKSPLLEECSFIAMAQMLHTTLVRDVFSHVRRVHILGHSLGGKIAGVYAMLYPHTVASLVILDIAPVAYPPFHKQELDALLKLFHLTPKLTSREEARSILQKEISDPLMVGFLMKNVAVDDRGVFLYLRIEPLKNYYYQLCAFPKARLDGKYFVEPTLFVRALQSEYIVPEHFKIIEHFFPSWKLAEINTGHMIHAEKPSELGTVLTEFYQSLS